MAELVVDNPLEEYMVVVDLLVDLVVVLLQVHSLLSLRLPGR